MPVDEHTGLVSDLLAEIPKSAVVPAVRAALGLTNKQTEKVVDAFDRFVAQPLEENLKRLHGRDLAKRNPLIYTVRGIERVEEWADFVLADKETSAIEGHLGTFLEEVARIVSGGIKPGSGVDLQVESEDGVIHLYAPSGVSQHEERRRPQGGRRGSQASGETSSRTSAIGRAENRRPRWSVQDDPTRF